MLKRWLLALLTPVPLLGLLGLPRYMVQWYRLRSTRRARLPFRDSYPCLTDWVHSTPFDPHYFFQAGWLARKLAQSKPDEHVDVGSDVRMIGVLSAFVRTRFIDFRPLQVELDGLECAAGNLTALELDDGSLPSLSCLHVIEHVGLGRYGDPLDIDGSARALAELQRVLSPGGRLYISVPVGRERICFNAHRVFAPATIIAALPALQLVDFSAVDDSGAFRPGCAPESCRALEYGCGMFVFEKPPA
jgi:SAM-dependent methyltransferase